MFAIRGRGARPPGLFRQRSGGGLMGAGDTTQTECSAYLLSTMSGPGHGSSSVSLSLVDARANH